MTETAQTWASMNLTPGSFCGWEAALALHAAGECAFDERDPTGGEWEPTATQLPSSLPLRLHDSFITPSFDSASFGAPRTPSSSSFSQGRPQRHPTIPTPDFSLPCSVAVSPSTDTTQAAGLLNFTLSQSPHALFRLTCDAGSAQAQLPVLNTALDVVLSAKRIAQQASTARMDLSFVPYFLSDSAESLGLLVFQSLEVMDVNRGPGQVLKMEASSNPIVAGMTLFNLCERSKQQIELIFTGSAARVALQALTFMRVNLANNFKDVQLQLSTIDYAVDGSGPKPFYLAKVFVGNSLLPCFQRQLDEQQLMARRNFDHSAAAVAAAAMQLSGLQLAGEDSIQARMGIDFRTDGMGLRLSSSGVVPTPRSSSLAHVSQTPTSLHAASMLPLGPPLFHAMPTPSTSSALLRPAAHSSRKADYVIVTEGTAIKYAAGAIAKVLGRVGTSGQCCPVYTEKKTESLTAVISVAVKAIAVARGYVCNEGTGHEVGFQPFLRALDRRPGAPEKGQGMGVTSGLVLGGGLLSGLDGMKGCDPSSLLVDDSFVVDDRCELAFDVFRVPQLPELLEANSIPVKVTAHSRTNVVSNILYKLVAEREAAVLITAGGKAMHVAMAAVVSTRARLKAKGVDILLLPKFVTVDTTSTMGWESVFLRFNIVRWALPAQAPPVSGAEAAVSALLAGALQGAPQAGPGYLREPAVSAHSAASAAMALLRATQGHAL